MGFEVIPETDTAYGLISFDAEGKERPEGSVPMSRQVIEKAGRGAFTDVFFFCHGWKGDVPAAREQYNAWMGALLTSADRQRAARVFPGFSPLLIGLHWPSQPWGDEELSSGAFGGSAPSSLAHLLESYLARLGDRAEIRGPLEAILGEARTNSAPAELPPAVRQAYLDLDAALGLGSGGAGAPPDADREGFDPDASFDAANQAGESFGGQSLGGLLGPLRQLSYWTMKKRARAVGEGGMHDFLGGLQRVTAARGPRVHLMGHSFGTIVVSGMLGGPECKGVLPRPVASVALVQGAVSLWSYASSIPYRGAGAGYFNRILADGKVRGPVITTRSVKDTAVGVLYPLASRVHGSAEFPTGPGAPLPEYGAMGAYGLQGLTAATATDGVMQDAAGSYSFEKGKVHNLEASRFIAKMEGASGAHSDIAGPEVAHALWEAAFASA
jgi:hypothetical protein